MLSLLPLCSVTLRTEADDILFHLKSPDYLAEIKRIKLRTTYDIYGDEVTGGLELVNTEGTRVCSERIWFEGGFQPPGQGGKMHTYGAAHLNLLRHLDGQSVEILCIDWCTRWDGLVVEFLKEALGFGNVRTLILSRNAIGPCLLALDEDPGASGRSRWFSPIHTLIIHQGLDPSLYLRPELMRQLPSIARRRKAAGFPFRSVSLFLRDGPGWRWDMDMEELKVAVEFDILGWDVDKYFLDGLDHLKWKN